MASPGQRNVSEHLTNQAGQEVLWLAASEPPPPFVAFLRSRGLTLLGRDEKRPMPAARLMVVEAGNSPATRAPSLSRRRLAVMHPDPGSADALAQALRAKGAEVAALSLNPESLHRVEALDPDVVIMEPTDFTGSCWEIVRALWQHPRLRFATLLLATPELMGSERVSALDVHDLSFAVHRLAEPYEQAVRAARSDEPHSLSLATLGPARTLRALLESGASLRARFVTADCTVEVDVAESIIVGAQSQPSHNQELLGVHALAFLMTQHAGTVEVRPVDHPAQTNVMAPLDTALHMAREVAGAQRPSGLCWAPIANHNAASQAPPARLSKPPISARTLIGIPAVKVGASIALDAPAQTRRGGREPANPGPLAKAAAPITVMPPAPRISIAPPKPAHVLPPRGLPQTKSVVPPARPSAPPAPSLSSVAPPAAPVLASLAPAAAVEPVRSSPPPAAVVAAPEIAETLEPSLLDELTPPRSTPVRVRELLQRVPLKLAAAGLLALIALWVCVRIVGALAAPAHSKAAAVAPPLPVAAAPTSATHNAAPSRTLPEATQDEEPVSETVRPSRKASELVSQGHVFRRKHMLPTARSRYLDALREYPGYPRALAGLAQVALESGNPAQALQFARQLVRVRSGQAGYHVLLGDALLAAGQTSQARAEFETAARMGSRAGKQRLAK